MLCPHIPIPKMVYPRSLIEGSDIPLITRHGPTKAASDSCVDQLGCVPTNRIRGSRVMDNRMTHSLLCIDGGYSTNPTDLRFVATPKNFAGTRPRFCGRRQWGVSDVCGECERRAHGRRAQGARSHLWVGIYVCRFIGLLLIWICT